jgi:hypothetical protein
VAQEQHRRKYKRWQREAPVYLWQLDLVGGIYLADGRECKMLTGIDDHSRIRCGPTWEVVGTDRHASEGGGAGPTINFVFLLASWLPSVAA